MLEDYRFNVATYIAVFVFGLVAFFAFMFFLASGLSWTDVNMQFFNTTFYIFFPLLIIGSIMFSIEKK